MADYRGMYSTLFNAVTDAINALQAAQRKTEEMYIGQDDPGVILLEKPDQEKE